jgi:hypothetical protein
MLWNKTDMDGLKKEVTSFSDTFLTAHTNTTNINSLWNDFKSGCLDIMNRYIPTNSLQQDIASHGSIEK